MVEQATRRCFIDYDARLCSVFEMAHDWLYATFLARWCFSRSGRSSSDKVKVCLLLVLAKKLQCCMYVDTRAEQSIISLVVPLLQANAVSRWRRRWGKTVPRSMWHYFVCPWYTHKKRKLRGSKLCTMYVINSLRGRRLKGKGKGGLGKGVLGAEKRERGARKEEGKRLPGNHCFPHY